jgi:hypothetical protein
MNILVRIGIVLMIIGIAEKNDENDKNIDSPCCPSSLILS